MTIEDKIAEAISNIPEIGNFKQSFNIRINYNDIKVESIDEFYTDSDFQELKEEIEDLKKEIVALGEELEEYDDGWGSY